MNEYELMERLRKAIEQVVMEQGSSPKELVVSADPVRCTPAVAKMLKNGVVIRFVEVEKRGARVEWVREPMTVEVEL